jgi:hypothetical protein
MAWHGLMSETGRASCTAASLTCFWIVRRANEGGRWINFRLQRLKGYKCCQIGLKVG